MQIKTAAAPQSETDTRTATQVLQIGVAVCLGLFLLWGVGFSHIDVLHNAAHDTRHSNAFPCH